MNSATLCARLLAGIVLLTQIGCGRKKDESGGKAPMDQTQKSGLAPSGMNDLEHAIGAKVDDLDVTIQWQAQESMMVKISAYRVAVSSKNIPQLSKRLSLSPSSMSSDEGANVRRMMLAYHTMEPKWLELGNDANAQFFHEHEFLTRKTSRWQMDRWLCLSLLNDEHILFVLCIEEPVAGAKEEG